MTNGSTGNLVSNNEARSTGDDSFALFSAIDDGGSDEIQDNIFENLSAIADLAGRRLRGLRRVRTTCSTTSTSRTC